MSVLDQFLGTQPGQPAFGEPRALRPWDDIPSRSAQSLADELTPKERRMQEEARRPRSVVGHVFDLLSRGEYFSASLANTLFNEDNATIGRALSEAFDEAVSPEMRPTFHDVIERHDPEFAKSHPVLTAILGLGAGIALDPLTYLSFGETGIARVAKDTGATIRLVKDQKLLGRVFERAGELGGFGRAAQRATRFDDFATAVRDLAEGGVAKVAGAARRKSSVRKALGEAGLGAEDLLAKGGIRFAGRTVASSKQLGAAADAVGLTYLRDQLAALPSVQQLRQIGDQIAAKFSRGKEVKGLLSLAPGSTPEDVQRVFRGYEKLRGGLETGTLRLQEEGNVHGDELARMLQGDRKSYGRVGEVLLDAQDRDARALAKIRDQEEKLREGMRHAGQFSEAEIQKQIPFRDDISEITKRENMRKAIRRGRLTPREKAALSWYSEFRDQIEENLAQAGLLKTGLTNYSTLDWKQGSKIKDMLRTRRAVLDPQLSELVKAGGGLPAEAGIGVLPGDQTVFALAEHARANGWEPVHDAVALAASRWIEHRKAILEAEGKASLDLLLPKDLPKAARTALERDFFRVLRHEPGLPANSPESVRIVLNAFDKLQGIFKRGATTYNPAFGIRNAMGQAFQAGAHAGRSAFDPTALSAAIHMGMFDRAPKALRGAFGEPIDVIKEFAERPVIKNGTIGLGGRAEGAVSLVQRGFKHVQDKIDAEKALGKLGDTRELFPHGWAALLKRALPYQTLAPRSDDMGRVASYLSWRALGNDPDEAFKLMEKSQFNYTTGLTRFEERVMSRLVPFYRFNKFATILTANVLRREPGRIANIGKAAETLGNAWAKIEASLGGAVGLGDKDAQPLTPSERHVIPGWMFEQPAAFAGYDPVLKQAVFRTLNGVSFLDWLNFADLDEHGQFDPEKSLVTGGVGQMTPFLKIPLEVAFKHDLFNGEAFGETGRSLGPIDEQRFFSTLGGLVGAAAAGGTVGGGAAGAAAGAGAGLVAKYGVPGVVRQITGWERAVDPRDGREKTYVNPLMMAVASEIFPQLRNAVQLSRDDRHPAERLARIVIGAGTQTMDLTAQQRQRIFEAKDELDKKVAELRRLARQGRPPGVGEPGEGDEALDDLKEAIRLLQDEATVSLGGKVRGR